MNEFELDDNDDEPNDRLAIWWTIGIVVPLIAMWLWVTSLP